MTLEEAIARSYLAEGLPPEDVALLARAAEVREFPPEEALVRQYGEDDDLMILMSGSARIMTHNGEYLGDLREASVFGEIALIDRRPRSATVVADSHVVVAAISGERWRAILLDRPDLAAVLLTNLCRAVCDKLRSTTKSLDAALLRN